MYKVLGSVQIYNIKKIEALLGLLAFTPERLRQSVYAYAATITSPSSGAASLAAAFSAAFFAAAASRPALSLARCSGERTFFGLALAPASAVALAPDGSAVALAPDGSAALGASATAFSAAFFAAAASRPALSFARCSGERTFFGLTSSALTSATGSATGSAALGASATAFSAAFLAAAASRPAFSLARC